VLIVNFYPKHILTPFVTYFIFAFLTTQGVMSCTLKSVFCGSDKQLQKSLRPSEFFLNIPYSLRNYIHILLFFRVYVAQEKSAQTIASICIIAPLCLLIKDAVTEVFMLVIYAS